jgi:ATP-binding cassette subfamily A (ABC1) protein 3
VLKFIPSFAFGNGILSIGNRSLYALIEGKKDKDDVYSMNIAGGDIIYLAFTGVFYIVLVFLVEKLS